MSQAIMKVKQNTFPQHRQFTSNLPNPHILLLYTNDLQLTFSHQTKESFIKAFIGTTFIRLIQNKVRLQSPIYMPIAPTYLWCHQTKVLPHKSIKNTRFTRYIPSLSYLSTTYLLTSDKDANPEQQEEYAESHEDRGHERHEDLLEEVTGELCGGHFVAMDMGQGVIFWQFYRNIYLYLSKKPRFEQIAD